jgi:hypothetical protein
MCGIMDAFTLTSTTQIEIRANSALVAGSMNWDNTTTIACNSIVYITLRSLLQLQERMLSRMQIFRFTT